VGDLILDSFSYICTRLFASKVNLLYSRGHKSTPEGLFLFVSGKSNLASFKTNSLAACPPTSSIQILAMASLVPLSDCAYLVTSFHA
jgi:hypothetical protein